MYPFSKRLWMEKLWVESFYIKYNTSDRAVDDQWQMLADWQHLHSILSTMGVKQNELQNNQISLRQSPFCKGMGMKEQFLTTLPQANMF